MKKIHLKPEEQLYKLGLFIYLMVIGVLITFFNTVNMNDVPFSLLILFLQGFYTVFLIYVNPYKQTLKIHSVTLLINQIVYIVFLIVINLINFLKNLS